MVKAINSGFRSLRELLAALLGSYGFWWQVRSPDPSIEVIVVCGLMVGASGAMAMFRPTGDLEEMVRRIVRETFDELPERDGRRER